MSEATTTRMLRPTKQKTAPSSSPSDGSHIELLRQYVVQEML